MFYVHEGSTTVCAYGGKYITYSVLSYDCHPVLWGKVYLKMCGLCFLMWARNQEASQILLLPLWICGWMCAYMSVCGVRGCLSVYVWVCLCVYVCVQFCVGGAHTSYNTCMEVRGQLWETGCHCLSYSNGVSLVSAAVSILLQLLTDSPLLLHLTVRELGLHIVLQHLTCLCRF